MKKKNEKKKQKMKYITILKLLLIIVVVLWIYNIEIKPKTIITMSYLNLVIVCSTVGQDSWNHKQINFQVVFLKM